MLGGWYCRSMANQEATDDTGKQSAAGSAHTAVLDDTSEVEPTIAQTSSSSGRAGVGNNVVVAGGGIGESVDYRSEYLSLKRKLKFLIYENEYFQDVLRFNQRRLLKVSRDRTFLLDRLLQYEKPDNSSSEDEATDSSDDEATTNVSATTSTQSKEINKKRKVGEGRNGVPSVTTGATRGRKRKFPQTQGSLHQQQPQVQHQQPQQQKPKQLHLQVNTQVPHIQMSNQQQQSPQSQCAVPSLGNLTVSQTKHEIQLTTAEITRQLQARKPTAIELMSAECTSATVPATMLSDESPSKCYPNDQLHHFLDDSSPSHVAAEECVPMEYTS